MKIRTSYFYQIRNFKRNMIPVSTAMWDPQWFHDNKGHQYIYVDKRGIINGLRLTPIIVQGNTIHACPCYDKHPESCLAMQEYRQELEKIDFNKLIKGLENYCKRYQELNHINEEIIIVLIVYETPRNPCSERASLIDYFNSHGVECKELEYPIK